MLGGGFLSSLSSSGSSDRGLSVGSKSSFSGSYGGLCSFDLKRLFAGALENRKYRSVYFDSWMYSNNPASTISDMFDSHFQKNGVRWFVLGNTLPKEDGSYEYCKIKTGLRGSNYALKNTIETKKQVEESLNNWKGRFSFLTLTCNFNKVNSVNEQIDLLRSVRNDLTNFLRNDFDMNYFWVWELNKKSGFFHIHLITLGKIPFDYLNGSNCFNKGKRKRGYCNLNEWLQNQHRAFESNSLDWEFIQNRKGKNKAGSYLTNYLVKQQGYELNNNMVSNSSKDNKLLSKKEKGYFLGLAYLKNLRLFGNSQGLFQSFDNSKKNESESSGNWVFVGIYSELLKELVFERDNKPPPDTVIQDVKEIFGCAFAS